MTDRVSGFIVTLEHDLREDDAKLVKIVLEQVKGVVDVSPVGPADALSHTYETRERLRLWEDIHAVFWRKRDVF